MTVDARLPVEIRDLWSGLDKQVTWLHGRWIIYRQLYGTSPERVEVLNQSAGTFFNVLQDVLLHDVQLSLSKLGDPAGTGLRTNMTLEALHQALVSAGQPVAADKMRGPLDIFNTECSKVRHRRDKWIAHFDLSTMLSEHVNPRVGPSREEIELALSSLRDTMNSVSVHFTETTIAYEHFSMHSDGEGLLYALRKGVRYKELVTSEVIPRDDYRKRFSGEI